MNKYSFHILSLQFLFFFVLIFGGCTKESTDPIGESDRTAAKDPYPLNVGNIWVFSEGGVMDTVTIKSMKVTEGRPEYYFSGNPIYYFSYPENLRSLVYVDSDLHGRSGMKTVKLLTHNPVLESETYFPFMRWETITTEFGIVLVPVTYTDTLTVVSLTEQVTVPAGQFQCSKYEWIHTSTVWYLWMADGIGIIKMNKSGVISELTSYTVK